MPPQSGIGGLCNLLQGFLDLVLAKIELPGVGGGPDGFDGMGLGDGDQPDVVRLAPGAAGRIRDALANLGQPLWNVLVHEDPGTAHGLQARSPQALVYFFNCAIIPFACVAYWPSGASFT